MIIIQGTLNQGGGLPDTYKEKAIFYPWIYQNYTDYKDASNLKEHL